MKYKITLRAPPEGNIKGFMDEVLEEVAKNLSMTDIVNGIHVVQEHEKAWVIMMVEPTVWQAMLPIMNLLKDNYHVDWQYKIVRK